MRPASLLQRHQSHHPSPAPAPAPAPSAQQGLKIAAAEDPFKLQAAWPSGNERRVPCLQSSNPKQIPLIFDVLTSRPWSTRIARVCAGSAFISEESHRQAAPKRATARGSRRCFGLQPTRWAPRRGHSWPFYRPTPDVMAGRTTGARSLLFSFCAPRDEYKRVDPLRLRGTWPSPSNPAAHALVASAARVPAQSGLRSEDNRECDCQARILPSQGKGTESERHAGSGHARAHAREGQGRRERPRPFQRQPSRSTRAMQRPI